MKPLGIVLIFLGIIIFMTGNLWATDIDGAYYYGYKWWHSSYGDDSSDIAVTYRISSNQLTADCNNEDLAIQAAFNTWEAVSTSYMAFSRGTDKETSDSEYGIDNVTNIIGWPDTWDHGSTALAVTWMNYNAATYRITDRDIEFNDTDFDWDTSGSPVGDDIDVETVALHEIGHFCGLGHSGSSSSIMYPTYAGVRITLHAYDEQSISYVYFIGTDDSYEHNEYPTKAATISAGTHSSLYLRDDDWYKISLSSGDDITVSLAFSDSNGDVDLELYNPSLSFLDGSYGVGDSEEVSATSVSSSGDYYILVYGYYCDTNTYSMTITTTAAPTPSGTNGTGGGISSGGKVCFIATSAYSRCTDEHGLKSRISTDLKKIEILQKFRDECLLTNPLGRAFVSYYERISPPIARYIENKEPLKAVVRFYLKPIVWLAEKVTLNNEH